MKTNTLTKKLLVIVALSGLCMPAQAMWNSVKKTVQKHPYVSGFVGALGVAGLCYGVYKNGSMLQNQEIEETVFQKLNTSSGGIYKEVQEMFAGFIEKDNENGIKELLKSNAVNVNKDFTTFIDSMSPLVFAIRKKVDISTIVLLLNHGACVNPFNSTSSYVPLNVAIEHGRFAVAKILLEYGADPILIDWQGDNAFWCFRVRNIHNKLFGSYLDHDFEDFFDLASKSNELDEELVGQLQDPNWSEDEEGDMLLCYSSKIAFLLMQTRRLEELKLIIPSALECNKIEVFEKAAQKLSCQPLKCDIEQIILKSKKGVQFQKSLLGFCLKPNVVDISWRFR